MADCDTCVFLNLPDDAYPCVGCRFDKDTENPTAYVPSLDRPNTTTLSPDAQRNGEEALMNGVVRIPYPGAAIVLPKPQEAAQASPLDTQVGGGHYKSKGIQPVEYIQANGLNFFEGNVVKYVTRHRDKKGAEDIRKIIHYAQMILHFEYGEAV